MTKNILKSFFLVTLASLLLFSCTNVNDPTAVLESNGVLKTNTLRGVSLKNLPSALDGQDVVIKINNNEVGKAKPVDGTLEVKLENAKFDAFASENVVTIQGMGSDKVTYKFGKFVDDTLALQYNYEFVEAGYSATEEPSFILTGEVTTYTVPKVYTKAYMWWWGQTGGAAADASYSWPGPEMSPVSENGKLTYKYTFDPAITTFNGSGAGVIFSLQTAEGEAAGSDPDKVSGGDLEGAMLAAVTGHGYYDWDAKENKFVKNTEKSAGATAITLAYTIEPISNVILPATFKEPSVLIIKNSFDNSELKLIDLVGFEGAVDGSNWSWNSDKGGKAFNGEKDQNPKVTSSTGIFVVDATTATPDWVMNQQPWTGTDTAGNSSAGSIGAFPEGFDAAYKIKLDKTEAWVPYKKGGKVEFSWLDRQ